MMGFPPSPTAQHHSTGGLAEVCQYCGQQITDEMEMWITSDHMLHGRISKNLAEQLCWSLAERSHVLQERLTQLPSEEEHYWRYRGLVDKAHPPPLPYPYPPPSPGTGNNEANPRGEEVSIHPRDVYVMGSDVLPGFDEGDILRYHPQHQVWFADPSIPLEGVVLAAMRPFSKRARESPPDDPHWVTKLVSVTRPEHEALVAEPYPLPPPTPEQAEAMRRDPSLRLVAERSGHFYVYRFERDGTTYFLGTVPNFANPNKKHRMMTATTGARAEEETTLGSAASGDLSSNEKKTPSNNNGEKREKPVHATTTTTTTTPQEEGGGGSGRPSSLSDSFWRSQKAVGVPPSVASALFTLLQDNLGPISSVFGSGVNNGTREGEGERVSSSSCRCPTATEEEGQLDRVNSNPIHGTHPNPHHADSPQPPPRPSSLARYLVDRVKSSKKQCASGFTRRVSDKDFAHQTTTGGYFYSATRWLLERLPSRGKGPGGSGRGGGATTTPTLLQAVNPSSGSAWEESIPSSYPVCAGSNSPDLYTPPAGSPYSINNNNAGVNNSNNTGDSLFFSRPFPPPPLNTVLGGTGSPHAYYGEAPLNVATSPMGGGGGMGSLPSPFYTSSTPWAQNNNINHTNNNSNYTWGGSGGGGGGVSCYGHSSQPSPLLQCHATPAGCTCATSSSHHNGLSCTTASPAGMSYQTLDTLPEDGVATYPPLAAAPMPPLPPPPPPPHTHHYRDASRSFSMHLRSPSTPSSYHSAVGQGPPPRSGLPLHPSGSGFDISVGGGGEMGGSVASTPKQRPPVRKHSNGSFSWDWRTNAELPFTRTE